LKPQIKYFKINSNYFLEGALVELIWKVQNCFIVKVHQDSWLKGWFYNSNRALIEVQKNSSHITLYAYGWNGLVSSKIKMNVHSFSKSSILKGNLKNDIEQSFPVRNRLSKNKKLKLINIDSKIKPFKISIKQEGLKIKTDTSNLKLN